MELKYILTLTNEKRFIQHKFGEERIEKRAEAHWYALDPSARTDYSHTITRLDLELQDYYTGFQLPDWHTGF